MHLRALILSVIALSTHAIGEDRSSLFSISSPVITCLGQAEYGAISIERLVIDKHQILIRYSAEGEVVIRRYVTIEFFRRNGSTDLFKRAYFLGGTRSGNPNDSEDISLPHYGQYKTGLGSEIAFNHGSERVFGTVTCEQN